MRYFLYGYYGHGNFGDELLLRGLIQGIRARDLNACFYVHSLDPTQGYAPNESVKFTGLARHMQNIRRRPWRLAIYLTQLIQWIRYSDVFVIGGGTLFIDKGRLNFSLVLLYIAVLFARLSRKRVVIVGVGIDHLIHPISRWLTYRIFAAAEFVAVREELALPYVAHRPLEQTLLSADLALTLDIPLLSPSTRLRRRVGICFIDYYRTVELSEKKHGAYMEAIVRFIDRNQSGYDFVCITFQRGIGQRDDWLAPMLNERFPDIPVTHIDNLETACGMAAAIDILVTTRFHLGILGAMWGRPVIVIEHELKMKSLASDFGFPSISLTEFVKGKDLDINESLRDYNAKNSAKHLLVQHRRVEQNFAWLPKRVV